MKAPQSSEIPWYEGFPKEPGWYPASVRRDPETLRWFNGVNWSVYAYHDWDADKAAFSARLPHEEGDSTIYWSNPWWEVKAEQKDSPEAIIPFVGAGTGSISVGLVLLGDKEVRELAVSAMVTDMLLATLKVSRNIISDSGIQPRSPREFAVIDDVIAQAEAALQT